MAMYLLFDTCIVFSSEEKRRRRRRKKRTSTGLESRGSFIAASSAFRPTSDAPLVHLQCYLALQAHPSRVQPFFYNKLNAIYELQRNLTCSSHHATRFSSSFLSLASPPHFLSVSWNLHRSSSLDLILKKKNKSKKKI